MHSMYGRLLTRYPNIYDLVSASPFKFKRGCIINDWLRFWNLVGARPCGKQWLYECAVCHNPIRNRNGKKHMVCIECLHKYLLDVKAKKRKPVLFMRLTAA